MPGRTVPRLKHLHCLIFLMPLLLLGCSRVGAQDEEKASDGVFTWSGVTDDVVLKVFRQSGMTRGRRVFTLYGSGELRMERFSANWQARLEERSIWLSDDRVRALLQAPVSSHLPEWTGEKLEEREVRQQIPMSADTPYLEVQISLTYYPPINGPIDHVAGFPVESMRDVAPILSTFDEVVAAWELESTLRQLWREAETGS